MRPIDADSRAPGRNRHARIWRHRLDTVTCQVLASGTGGRDGSDARREPASRDGDGMRAPDCAWPACRCAGSDCGASPLVVSSDVVRLVERVLERAREGDLAGVAIAVARADGSTATACATTTGPEALIGALGRLQERLSDGHR